MDPHGAIDLYLRLVFIGALVASAIASFSVGQPYATTWLALKVLLFAGAVSCGVAIRTAATAFIGLNHERLFGS